MMNKINNRGYLTIELIVSFTIAFIIIISMLSTTFILKGRNDYIGIDGEFNLLKVSFLSKLYDDFLHDTLMEINTCGSTCYEFVYANAGIKQLKINNQDKIIEYGEFSKKINTNVTIGTVSITHTIVPGITDTGYNDAMMELIIPLHSVDLNKEYDIKAIYMYDSRVNSFTS